MDASLFGTFLGAVAVLFVLGMAAMVVGALLVARAVHRRWRRVRSHGIVIALLAIWDATAALRVRRRPRTTVGESLWASPKQVRRVLRRAVADTVDSVRTAEGLGAPVGELPAVTRRLQATAADLDRVLRLEPQGSVPANVRDQVRDLLRAAGEVRSVAVVAAGDACDPAVAELVRDAADEARLLQAGLLHVRSASRATSPGLD